MGTRNLTAVFSGGEYKLAQYGQWDGYPAGQGVIALTFCRKHLASQESRETFKKKLELVHFCSPEELANFYKEVGVADGEQCVNMKQQGKFDAAHPYFSRDHGAKILQFVMDADGPVDTRNSIDFAKDSFFCEWAYVIDLDKNVLEAFRGFNHTPLDASERFAVEGQSRDEYYPVRLAGSWPLDKLPDYAEFVAHFAGEE